MPDSIFTQPGHKCVGCLPALSSHLVIGSLKKAINKDWDFVKKYDNWFIRFGQDLEQAVASRLPIAARDATPECEEQLVEL